MSGAPVPASVAWPVVPGKFAVVTYRADFSRPGPATYTQANCYPHRTLPAACRRLASLLSMRNNGRLPAVAYIITPKGERLPLRVAQARLKGGKA